MTTGGMLSSRLTRDDVLEGRPGCQLHVEILSRLATPGGERRLTIGQNDEPCAMLRDGLDEVERVIAVPSGENSAEVGVPHRSLREQHGPIGPV